MQESALRRGRRETVFTTEEVLSYRRLEDDQSLLCVMNLTEQTADLEMDITESTPLIATSSDCRIELDGGKKRIVLPPFGGMVLE